MAFNGMATFSENTAFEVLRDIDLVRFLCVGGTAQVFNNCPIGARHVHGLTQVHGLDSLGWIETLQGDSITGAGTDLDYKAFFKHLRLGCSHFFRWISICVLNPALLESELLQSEKPTPQPK